MNKVKQAGMLEKWVGGVGFRMHRRTTLLMAQARGLMAVAGQIAGANSEGAEPSDEKAAEFIKSVLSVALVEIEDGSGWAPIWDNYTLEMLAAFTDVLFMEFMGSGLSVDPTPPSCAG